MLDNLKIAIVCDWLTIFAGAEKVIYHIHELFPKAPIFTSVYNKKKCPIFEDANITESFIKYLPGSRNLHRLYFPFMPMAFEIFDFSEFDLVISSSHSASKGIVTKPETLHVSYCHSPMRYVWDQSHEYQEKFKSFSAFKLFYRPILHKIRMWDRIASSRVDKYIANSEYVKNRIKKYYKRDSEVIYPPVNLDLFSIELKLGAKGDDKNNGHFIAVGRLIPYKRFDLIIKAFNRLGLPLKIVGTGNQMRSLKKMAKSNIEFLGNISDESLRDAYKNSKALIYPQVEDFGIVPLEAMASGKPVIAFRKGGSLETIKDGVSGIFFDEQNEEALINSVRRFEKMKWDSEKISMSVMEFSPAKFKSELMHFLDKSWKEHQQMLSSR